MEENKELDSLLFNYFCRMHKINLLKRVVPSSDLLSEYRTWLLALKSKGMVYKQFLIDNKLLNGNDKFIELYKSDYDTISGDNIKSMSPYTNFNDDVFFLTKKEVPIIREHGKWDVLPDDRVLITHNPYANIDLSRLSKSSYYYDVPLLVGMYGSLYEPDVYGNITKLQISLRNMVNGHNIFDTACSSYFTAFYNDAFEEKYNLKK